MFDATQMIKKCTMIRSLAATETHSVENSLHRFFQFSFQRMPAHAFCAAFGFLTYGHCVTASSKKKSFIIDLLGIGMTAFLPLIVYFSFSLFSRNLAQDTVVRQGKNQWQHSFAINWLLFVLFFWM